MVRPDLGAVAQEQAPVQGMPDQWRGLGLVQLVTAFFSKPIRDLQQNLNNLASFRMILEGHSLKTAFTRFHLTTPQALRELRARLGHIETGLHGRLFKMRVQAFDVLVEIGELPPCIGIQELFV